MSQWFKIAWRNVARNRRRSMVAIWTVAIVSSSIIVAHGYINFTFWGLTRVIVQGGTGNMQLVDKRMVNDFETELLAFGLDSKTANETVAKLEATQPVRRAMQRLLFTGIVSKDDSISTVFRATGIESKKEKRLQQGNAAGAFVKGAMFKDTDKNPYQAVLAIDLAKKLSIDVGDEVVLLANTVEGGINAIDATVSGIYDTGIPITNQLDIKVPLALAQQLLLTDKVSNIVVQLRDIEATKSIFLQIKALVKGTKMTVQPWYDIKPYFKAVEIIYYSIFTVMGVIIMTVALLSVANVMGTTVNERVPEIGTLRAFGIEKWQLRLNFVFEGLIIGFIGAVLGIILGFVLAFTISQAGIMMPPPPGRSTEFPLLILPTMGMAIWVLLAMSLLGVAASYLPINKILKKKVIEQLSHT
ncbi:ABC transporter permease [Candidatus Thiodubiliella endoseptemdiera]|uniref:ABC transporter permease n=1 Tax=Candidatus Thiodubiliella endoseptemdiera TaxID=2738886 RepID=UPI0034DE33B5